MLSPCQGGQCQTQYCQGRHGTMVSSKGVLLSCPKVWMILHLFLISYLRAGKLVRAGTVTRRKEGHIPFFLLLPFPRPCRVLGCGHAYIGSHFMRAAAVPLCLFCVDKLGTTIQMEQNHSNLNQERSNDNTWTRTAITFGNVPLLKWLHAHPLCAHLSFHICQRRITARMIIVISQGNYES